MIRLRWKTLDLKQTTKMLMRKTTYDTLPKFLRWRAKIVVQDLIRLTPPTGFGWPAQKKQGEAAVTRDINKVFSELGKFSIVDPKLRKEWQKALRARNMPALEALAKVLGIRFVRIIPEADGALHQRMRNRRGRVPGKLNLRRNLVIKQGSIPAYINRVKRRVGWLKWGWGKAAIKLGAQRLPRWVTGRHRAGGACKDRSRGLLKPIIRLENDRPVGGADPNDIVEPALRINRDKMVKELKAILEWELKKASRR